MIDSNNKLNSLSKSLIEATRSVMEKKTNKHGHDAVGHEDSDIDNDGDTDKSDSYLHNRRKAIKHAMKKEEVEEIDELSKSTLGSYIKKAAPSAIQKGIEHGVKKAERDEMDRNMNRHMSFSDKDKIHDIMKTTHKDVDKPREKALRRNQGIIRATNRLTKEELEEFDEGYTAASNRAEASRQRAIKNAAKAYKTHGNMDRAIKDHDLFAKDAAKIKAHLGEEIELDEAMNANDRFKHHHETAKTLLKSITNHLNTEHASAMKAKDHRGNKGPNWSHVSSMEHVANQLGQIHDMLARKGEYSMHESVDLDEAPVAGVAPGSMADDGHLCATKVFHKEWAEGTPIFSQHAEPDEYGDIAWYDVMFEHGIEKMVPTDEMEILMAESHERHGKRKMKEDLDESAKIAAHLIKRYGDNVRKSHVRSAADDFGVGYVALSHAVRKKLGVNRLEEEQIDELSKDTLGNYVKRATNQAIVKSLANPKDDSDDMKTIDKREKGVRFVKESDDANTRYTWTHGINLSHEGLVSARSDCRPS
jgi:hypothetical protein